MSVSLVVYDLDGTLIDTLADVRAALNLALADFNLPQCTVEDAKPFFGKGIRELIGGVIARHPDSVEIDPVLQRFREFYALNLVEESKLFDGLEKTLQWAEDNNISQAVLTNKSEAPSRAILQTLNLMRYFELVVGPDTYDAYKPSPKGLLEILKYHNVSAGEAVMIGDSEADILAAQGAGVRSIAVGYSYQTLESLSRHNPTYMVQTVDDLHTLIKTLV
jgi:phosphoglycolate phosphatase